MKKLQCEKITPLIPAIYLSMVCLLTTFFSPFVSASEWFDDQSAAPYRSEKSEDGSVYQFKFLTTPGVNYSIQSSGDFNTWTDTYFYRGLGNTVTHPLFPLPQKNTANPIAEPDLENYVPTINGSFRIIKIVIAEVNTGLLIRWVSSDDEQPKDSMVSMTTASKPAAILTILS